MVELPSQVPPLWGPDTKVDGRYRIERRLGTGGMGEVYQAHDETLDRRVALKRVYHDTLSQQELKDRALNEARLIGRFQSPYIANIHDVVLWENELILVLELVSGATLREEIAGSMEVGRFYDLALQICRGIHAAHEGGLVHGDLKPDNVMVDVSGQIKILDFGVARRLAGSNAMEFSRETGTTAGTPAYTSPEVHQGSAPSTQSDVFALGVIFYELLIGTRPFRGNTLALELEQILKHDPPPLGRHRTDLPGPLQHLVQAMLAKDPSRRPTLGIVIDSLKALAASGSDPTPLRTIPLPSSPRSAVRIGAALGVVAVMVLAAVFVLPKLLPPEKALPDHPLLAVLPPVVPYQDPDDQAFAVGCAAFLTDLLGRESLSGVQVAHFRKVLPSKSSPVDLRRQWGVTAMIETAFQKEGGRTDVQMELSRTDSVGTLATLREEIPIDTGSLVAFLDRSIHELLQGETPARWYSQEGDATLRYYILGLGNYWMAKAGDRELEAQTRLYEEARKNFELAVGTRPAFPRGHAALSRTLLDWSEAVKGRDAALAEALKDDAFTAAATAVSQDSLLAEAHYIRAAALRLVDRTEEAEGSYRRAVALDPLYYEPVDALWKHLYRSRRFEEAHALLEDQIAANPQDFRNYVNIGYVHRALGDYENALASTERGMERAPEYYLGYSNAGGIAIQAGDYALARTYLSKAASMYPDGRILANLGTAHYYSRDFKGAADAYDDAIERFLALGRKPDFRMWRNLGDALYQISPESARTAYDNSLQLLVQQVEESGADPYLDSRRALLCSRLGRQEEARRLLEALPADAPANVLSQAALTWVELQELDLAVQVLLLAVEKGLSVEDLRNSAEYDPFREDARVQQILNPSTG